MNIIEADKVACMEECHYKALSNMVDQKHPQTKYQKKSVIHCD
jgi:hypothetical protein